jgi:hypothetical protein
MAKGLKQGGHQLAPGQVAGAAKHDKIEAHEQKSKWVIERGNVT